MLENRTRKTGLVHRLYRFEFLRILGAVVLLSALIAPTAQAQKPNNQNKPLPAKSNPTAFYTPEGQQQVADAILTEVIDQLSDQADAHFEMGEYNHSINLYRVIAQGNPRRVDAFESAGYLLWSTGQSEAAIAFLKQGLAANTDTYYMYDELGAFFYICLKDYPKAIPYYEQAIKYPDSRSFTWTNLAHCYEKVGQWDKAVRTWTQASNFVGGKDVSAQVARSNSDMIQHNLTRAKAELAKRQKPNGTSGQQ